MSLTDRIDQDLTTAMREGIAAQTAVLRLLKSAIKNEQIKLGHDLSESEVIKVLQREAKQRRDSISAYNDGGRPELAAAEEMELKLIADYLPEALDESELKAMIEKVVTETGASGPAEMGVIIAAVMSQAAGRASGAEVSQLVRERLIQ